MSKRKPPSDETRQKNRERERARRAWLSQRPEWRARENERLRPLSARRRADPDKLAHDRQVNAARMKTKRDTDPDFADRQREAVRIAHERYRLDREQEAFMARQMADGEAQP